MSSIWIYDIEVFKHDWVVIFLNAKTEEMLSFHNSNSEIQQFLSTQPILVGFNNKLFDDYILWAIVHDVSPNMVKDISDFIVSGNLPWEHHIIAGLPPVSLCSADVRNDMYQGLSLKSIEGHLGMPIVESSVPFDIDRSLTQKELTEVIEYCHHDTLATKRIFHLREDYFKTKLRLAKLGDIDPKWAFGMTNAKLTAAYLGAKAIQHSDGRTYTVPDEVDTDVLPIELLDFFRIIDDSEISDDELYSYTLDIQIAGLPCAFAWGGVHGSKLQYRSVANDEKLIGNQDVASLYPSLMLEYDYISRNISSPELFQQTYARRMTAKAEGHEDGSTLKLPLNTASGAMENPYNAMYDPRQSRGLRITGQLLMAELVLKIADKCPTFHLLNLNTDGFMYEISKSEKPILDIVCKVWENSKRLRLEETKIKRVWIKDVNNLLFVTTDNKVTAIGGYLVYGISNKAAWTVNNNATIVSEALIQKMAYDIPIDVTINNCTDILKFQLIAHAGQKYESVYQETTEGIKPIQRTNRVYASRDKNKGTLFKVKNGKERGDKIAGLPEHCLIDNELKATIDQIDKDWYITLAEKRFTDFTGGGKCQQITFLK